MITVSQNLNTQSIIKFNQSLEQSIQHEINEAYPLHWEEDYITRRLLTVLAGLNNSQIEVLNSLTNVFIKPFKLKGVNEHKFGDIAILVEIEYKDGDKLKGVAFLEAKRKFRDSSEYDSLDFEQLKRIYSNAPNSRLLLYNYNAMSAITPTGLDTKHGSSGMLPQMPVTHTTVLNLNAAIQFNIKSEHLHKVSIPFSYQFTYRYLYGLDLEFDEEKIKAAQGFLADKIGLSNFVVLISIKPGKKNEKEVSQLFSPQINRELYAE
ncbi:MAG TPA: hypothetical protein VGI43_19335, partial [Mucilaginibacter sp.]